mmetsp:Transcript_40921/g.55584  ORF Transcript_40921/g.55584 Transcript_40921/m.55584 type:complete len:98 (-) Transcript_40921:1015-1308(-)
MAAAAATAAATITAAAVAGSEPPLLARPHCRLTPLQGGMPTTAAPHTAVNATMIAITTGAGETVLALHAGGVPGHVIEAPALSVARPREPLSLEPCC